MDTGTLITAVTALFALTVWLVKAMISRSDRLIEQRDKEVHRSFVAFEKAVKTFDECQTTNRDFSLRVLDRLDRSEIIQGKVLETLQEMQAVQKPEPT